MSGRTDWQSICLPEWFKARYGTDTTERLNTLLSAGRLEWRITGSTHFQIRARGEVAPVTLTTGRTATNPVYKAKLRTALRRWGCLED